MNSQISTSAVYYSITEVSETGTLYRKISPDKMAQYIKKCASENKSITKVEEIKFKEAYHLDESPVQIKGLAEGLISVLGFMGEQEDFLQDADLENYNESYLSALCLITAIKDECEKLENTLSINQTIIDCQRLNVEGIN
jgi:hypothetical protein